MRPIPTKETEKGTMRICPNGLITKISQLRQCDSLKRCC